MTPHDIRDEIFRSIANQRVAASIASAEKGIIAGAEMAMREAAAIGLSVSVVPRDGQTTSPGDGVMRFSGSPKEIAMAEERLIGCLAKPSGIATAARRFVEKAGQRPEVVSGAWKKMPPGDKEMIRTAIIVGGARARIVEESFVYLDKNYVAMLGGIAACLQSVAHLDAATKVIQLGGVYGKIAEEARMAAQGGADIVFIDTGNAADVRSVSDVLCGMGIRNRVRIAFAGGITLEIMDELVTLDIDIVDIGRSIVDAPLLDMKMEVKR